MVHIAGADHFPEKFFPVRQSIGPRPPLPPTPKPNFLTPGRTMTHSALRRRLVGTALPLSMACKTVTACVNVSSSLFLLAPHTTGTEIRNSMKPRKALKVFRGMCFASFREIYFDVENGENSTRHPEATRTALVAQATVPLAGPPEALVQVVP